VRCLGRSLAVFALSIGVRWAAAQELPGTPSGQLPPTLRSPYGEGVGKPAPEPPPPTIQIIPVPVARERPRFTLVPDLRLASGYSDNIFITPDVLGFRAVEDGLFSVSPRLRALYRLSRDFGIIGDYSLSYTQFLSHGNSLQNAGAIFLGYRPTVATHAELGVRGGTARVSEFAESNDEEGHLFASGSVPLTPFVGFGLSASVGLREFPDRTRAESRALSLGIGPIVLPLPGSVTTVEKGEQDVVTNVATGLSVDYAASGALHAAYDFLDNNAEFSELRFQSHRLSFAAVNAWNRWLGTQLAYSVSFRHFSSAQSDSAGLTRRDALQDIGAGVIFAPGFLRELRFARSGTIRVDYDRLINRSNLGSADLDRNFVSLALEMGFLPLTGEQIGRLLLPGLYGMPPSKSTSSSAALE
jgi:hypothetical protein